QMKPQYFTAFALNKMGKNLKWTPFLSLINPSILLKVKIINVQSPLIRTSNSLSAPMEKMKLDIVIQLPKQKHKNENSKTGLSPTLLHKSQFIISSPLVNQVLLFK